MIINVLLSLSFHSETSGIYRSKTFFPSFLLRAFMNFRLNPKDLIIIVTLLRFANVFLGF
jgi:hypothetical protein